MYGRKQRLQLCVLCDKDCAQLCTRRSFGLYQRVHTEWQLPISGELSIMMEKSALNGEGGGARLPPYMFVTITYKVAVCAPSERADIHSTYFTSTPIRNSVDCKAGHEDVNSLTVTVDS